MRLRGGGLIGASVAPTLQAAPGLWSLGDVHAARRAGIWPEPDPIASIFADDTDGFCLDFSEMGWLFQGTTGVPVGSPAESIGVALESHAWVGRTLAQALAAQPELVTNGSFDTDITGWAADFTGTLSHVSGRLRLTQGSSGGGAYGQGMSLLANRLYRGSGVISNVSSSAPRLRLSSTSSSGGGLVDSQTGAGDRIFFHRPTSNITAYPALGAGGTSGSAELDDYSVKEIPGNHGLQATASAQPKFQAGGIARFDGANDNLATPLRPGAAMTYMFKGKITSASKVLMGSRAASNTGSFIGTDAAGLLAAGVGSDGTTTIKGGSDIRGTTGVGALVYSAGGVRLYWNGLEIYSGPLNGVPNTSIPILLGCLNDNGSSGTFADADVSHSIAIRKALTPPEIAAITNKWGTS